MSEIQEIDNSVDILRSLLWTHNKSVNLTSLLQSKQDWYQSNYSDFWDDWITDVFDIRTANDFGLAVWSVILNLPLFGDDNVSPPDYPAFGFDPFALNFDNGNFATDARGAFGISTERKRILLRLRYYQLVTRGSQLEVNEFLNDVFGPDEIYMIDGLNMTITYVLTGATARSLQTLFELFDILPRPTGVRIIFVDSDLNTFGFGPTGLNFDNGSFTA